MPTRADYAKIHIAKKELGLSEDEYRALLWDRFKAASAKDLSPAQVGQLLAHFRKLGWQPKAKVKNGRAGTTQKSSSFIKIKPGPAARQQRYILALWNALGYDVAKLHSRCKKQFKRDRFEWVTDHADLRVLITDLQARCRRAGINPAG